MGDIGKGIVYHCRYCLIKNPFRTTNLENMSKHINKCKAKIYNLIKDIDYVVCGICNEHCYKLAGHLLYFHKNITKEKYIKKYGCIISEVSSKKYSQVNKERPDWRIKARENGFDVEAHDKEVGKKISETIMSNKEERNRRAESLKQLRKTKLNSPEVRKIFSDSAKITSARKDIQANRAENLKKWRDNNPKEFKKCTDAMRKALINNPPSITVSKPEKLMINYLNCLPGFNFEPKEIKSEIFDWESGAKLIDGVDLKNNIFFEYDGPTHFKNLYSNKDKNILKLEKTKHRDVTLNKYIEDNNFTLIRVSYDQFNYRRKNIGFFEDTCIKSILDILLNNKKGVFKIGNKYE